MQYESIGKYIRKYRKERRLRQEDLGNRTNLSTNYIGMIERGEKIPSLESLVLIANALEVSADNLLCDVLDVGYQIKHSQLDEKLSKLSKNERMKIYDVVDTLLRHI